VKIVSDSSADGPDECLEKGYVGRIIAPSDVDRYYWGDKTPPKTEYAITVENSRLSRNLDRLLERVTLGVLGYSIEPADADVIHLKREVAELLETGQRILYDPQSGRLERGVGR
jgi:hypothetical protein